jgi:hypothetical protein
MAPPSCSYRFHSGQSLHHTNGFVKKMLPVTESAGRFSEEKLLFRKKENTSSEEIFMAGSIQWMIDSS